MSRFASPLKQELVMSNHQRNFSKLLLNNSQLEKKNNESDQARKKKTKTLDATIIKKQNRVRQANDDDDVRKKDLLGQFNRSAIEQKYYGGDPLTVRRIHRDINSNSEIPKVSIAANPTTAVDYTDDIDAKARSPRVGEQYPSSCDDYSSKETLQAEVAISNKDAKLLHHIESFGQFRSRSISKDFGNSNNGNNNTFDLPNVLTDG